MQKILMNYYEYDKERHIIMVDVYLLPANEGDCLWVRYGKKEGTRHNIIIDGGVESNGGDIASIIENIAERNEKVDIFVTHIDGDHIRGLIKGIGISNAEVLKKCVDTIYFNNKKDILDKFRIDSISSEGLEESTEQDAYWTLSNGTELAMGGLSVSLRDYARFARLYLNGGSFHGDTVVF